MASTEAHDLAIQENNGDVWGGFVSPMRASYGKLMMWFFLVSDALSFTGLLAALGFARHRLADAWPSSETVFYHFPFMGDTNLPLLYVAMMTFILIMSSVTMVLAVEAGHRMDKKKVVMWLGLTVLGGFIFLGSQVWEWAHFIHGRVVDGELMHATMTQNPYGPQQYAQFFFLITGFHGFHVFSGVVINIVILINVLKNTYEKRGHYEMVEKTGLYWHFVDLVWVFVFTFFYLL